MEDLEVFRVAESNDSQIRGCPTFVRQPWVTVHNAFGVGPTRAKAPRDQLAIGAWASALAGFQSETFGVTSQSAWKG